MSDLRETIALELARAWLGPKTAKGSRPDHIWLCVEHARFIELAGRILAIPAIAEALEAKAEVTALRHDLKRSMDRENTSLNLGHSITVHRD